MELPGADSGGPKKVVLVSYIPLLTGEPGRVLPVGDEEFKQLMADAVRYTSGMADVCLWMAEGGGVFPVFVLPQAQAIADHLLAWSENRPGRWFALCYAQRRGRYVAALVPNLVRSVERFEAAHVASHGEPSMAASYELLFRPIAFVSGVRHTFKKVKKLIGSESMVGFVEPSDFDPATPSSLKPERIKRVGPFPVCRNAKPFGISINSIINKLVGFDS